MSNRVHKSWAENLGLTEADVDARWQAYKLTLSKSKQETMAAWPAFHDANYRLFVIKLANELGRPLLGGSDQMTETKS